MRKILHKYTLLTFLAIFTLSNCQPIRCGSNPNQLLRKMESLVDTVKENRKSSDANDWEAWDHEFVNYYENCYDDLKAKMDAGQKGKFVGLSIKYVSIRLGNEISTLFSEKKNESSEFSEILKNIAEELKGEKK